MKKDTRRYDNAERIMKSAGYSCKPGKYAKGGGVHADEAEDKKLIKKMIKADDKKHKKEHKKEGGFVHGGLPNKRLDKVSRQTAKGSKFESVPNPPGKEKYAKGGKVKGKAKTQINVIVGHSGQQPGQPVPIPVPAQAAPQAPVARPPMPPQAAPGGLPPQGMPMQRKKGGAIDMQFGSGGGKGRLEKIKAYEKEFKKKD